MFSISICKGQSKEKTDSLKLKDFEFYGWFGYRKDQQADHVYSLLGTGFFIAPSTGNIDTLISTWIEQHPNATIIPVYTFGPAMNTKPSSKQTYCWIVDGLDTLNIFLVRQGAVPGGTMQRPRTWKEMTRKEKELYDDRPDEKVHLKEKEYQVFIEKAKIANEFARNNKIGIYKVEESEKE